MIFGFTKINRLSVFESFAGLDWAAVKTLLSGWEDGTKGYFDIKKEGKRKSSKQLGYYYAKPVNGSSGGILQQIVDAFRKNEDFSLTMDFGNKTVEIELTRDNMDNFLKLRYAAMTGEYKNKEDMDMSECSAFEDWCIKWAAKWLNCQIPPSDPNWKQNK